MYGTATAIALVFQALVSRSKPVYVTLDCKYWLADELHLSTGAKRRFHSVFRTTRFPVFLLGFSILS